MLRNIVHYNYGHVQKTKLYNTKVELQLQINSSPHPNNHPRVIRAIHFISLDSHRDPNAQLQEHEIGEKQQQNAFVV